MNRLTHRGFTLAQLREQLTLAEAEDSRLLASLSVYDSLKHAHWMNARLRVVRLISQIGQLERKGARP